MHRPKEIGRARNKHLNRSWSTYTSPTEYYGQMTLQDIYPFPFLCYSYAIYSSSLVTAILPQPGTITNTAGHLNKIKNESNK